MIVDLKEVTFGSIKEDHLQQIGSHDFDTAQAAFSAFGHNLQKLTSPTMYAGIATGLVEFAGHVANVDSGQLAGPAGIAAIGTFIARSLSGNSPK